MIVASQIRATVSRRPFIISIFAVVALICAGPAGAAPPHVIGMQPVPAAGSVEVVLFDITGAPVGDAVVLLQRGAETALQVPLIDVGRYQIARLVPGSYVVTVVKDGFQTITRAVTVQPGRGITVRLELAPATLSEQITVEAATTVVDGTATKLPTTLHETPRSLTVIDADRMREQNFQFVHQALAYVPGMTANSHRTGGYHFYSRGYRMLPEDTRVDGFAGVNAGGRYSASLFGIEQAVFLRGPAGILYGSAGSPGGLINLVTKKPQAARANRVDLRFGGYAGQGVSAGDRGSAAVDLDSTGPLTESGRVLYRALFTMENASYFTSGVDDRNRYANGSLTFKLDENGRYLLTPMVQWTKLNRPHGGGIVVSPSTSLSTNDGVSGPINMDDLTPISVNLSSGGGIDETLQTGMDVRAAPTPRVRLAAAYRFFGYDTDISQFAPQVNTALLATQNLIPRVESQSRTERRFHNYDVNGIYELKTAGSWKTLLQAGVTGRLANTRGTSPAGAVPGPQSPINIYTGVATSPLVSSHPLLTWGAWTESTFWNTYLQNQTSIANGRLVATFGLGYGENRPAQNQPTRKSELMPNAAIVFNVDERLAVYSSYATSYNPTDPSAEDALGRQGTFDPTLGLNAEVGAKYDLPDARASWAVALFHNEIDNALVQSGVNDLNPNGNRYFAAAGTRRSRGIEVSSTVAPVEALRITGSVTYLNAIYTGAGLASAAATSAIPGSRAEKSPEWSYSLWGRYDWSAGALNGLGAGLGVIWQDERLGGNGARTPAAPDPLVLPAFTRVDAALYYRLGSHADIGLNIENLFDELIFVSGTVGSSLEIAAPRTLSLRLGYRF